MTSIIVFAAIALIALGAFSIINTVQKFNDELHAKEYHRRRQEGHVGMPSWR